MSLTEAVVDERSARLVLAAVAPGGRVTNRLLGLVGGQEVARLIETDEPVPRLSRVDAEAWRGLVLPLPDAATLEVRLSPAGQDVTTLIPAVKSRPSSRVPICPPPPMACLLLDTPNTRHSGCVSTNVVPHSVVEATVRVAGEALYWKRSLRRILRTSGVSEAGVLRHEHLSKSQIVRAVWAELDAAGPRGLKVQRNIVAALANLDAPEPQADQRVGQEALNELRRLSQAHGLLVDPDQQARKTRAEEYLRRAEEREERESRRARLAAEFRDLHQESNAQARGYAFERLLGDLFRMYELDFKGSYRTDIDQVDGALKFEAFTYLLEARWRSAPAVDSDLVILKARVERRIESTRGMFISMAGFRAEVAERYRLSHEQRLILVDGEDLALILEGHVELPDALRAKVSAAAIDGEPFLQLRSLL